MTNINQYEDQANIRTRFICFKAWRLVL